MNAVIGDDGIITKAQDAKMKTGIVALEEFLQEKYVENFETVTDDSEGINKSSLEKLMSIYSTIFYSEGNKDYVLQEYNHIDDEGNVNVDFLKLRLIRKKNLPKEIRDQIVGGDAIGISGNEDSVDAYDKLQDVYGITNDLKVFYCSDGIASAIGADYTVSDIYDGTKAIYDSTSSIGKAITNTVGEDIGELSMQSLRTITELKIDETTGMRDLTCMADLPNLSKLTLTNYNGSLKGIEKAYKLKYIYFSNINGSQEIDYVGLNTVINLEELYFFMPTNIEVEKMCAEMSKTDYKKLSTIGLYGYMHSYYINAEEWRRTMTSNVHASLDTVASLGNLTNETKKAVVTLYLQNNSLTNLNGLEEFTNVYKFLATKNFINNIDAVAYMTRLNTFNINSNALTTESIKALENHSSLKYLMLQDNVNITSLESISKTDGTPGTQLIYFNANDLTELNFTDEYWNENSKKVIFTISTVLLPSKYSMAYLNVKYFRPTTSVTDDELELLRNNIYITSINLSGCLSLTHNKIASVLPTIKNLKEINLNNTKLNSLAWMSNIETKTTLRGINIQNTSVTDITPLCDFTNLGCLVINGSTIKLYDSTNETLNTKITNLIISIANHNYGGWSNTCLGYGGFIPNSTYLQDQMKDLTKVTKWTFNALGNVNVDLSGWDGLTYLGGYCGSGKIILPPTIQNFGADANATYYLDNPSNDFSISVSFSRQVPVITNNTKNYTLTVSGATKSPTYYSSLFTPYLKTLTINAGGEYSEVNASGIDYTGASNLKNLTLSSYIISKLDFSLLPTSLENLSITNCKIKNIVSSEPINVKNINFANNSISSVSIFSNANIEVLNLKNNSITNYVTLSTGNGTVTKKTCEVLAGITGLEKIYLSGNEEILDFSPLINAGFKDDGNHNFTK